IAPDQKRRPRATVWAIGLAIFTLSGLALYFAWPRTTDQQRIVKTGVKPPTNSAPASFAGPGVASANPASGSNEGPVLTVPGYIVNRERIELSPRFLGVVKWIGVKKGDAVTNGQVVVLLDDTEYKARLHESEGRLASAKAGVRRAELDFERVTQLAKTDIESKK